MTNGSNGIKRKGKEVTLACAECNMEAGLVILDLPKIEVNLFIVHPSGPHEPHVVASDPPVDLNLIDMR